MRPEVKKIDEGKVQHNRRESLSKTAYFTNNLLKVLSYLDESLKILSLISFSPLMKLTLFGKSVRVNVKVRHNSVSVKGGVALW